MGMLDFLFGKKREKELELEVVDDENEPKKGEIRILHSFDLHGVGMIVVGSILKGDLRTGTEIYNEWGSKGSVYGIEINHKEVQLAREGQRANINIKGIKKTELEAGQHLMFEFVEAE